MWQNGTARRNECIETRTREAISRSHVRSSVLIVWKWWTLQGRVQGDRWQWEDGRTLPATRHTYWTVSSEWSRDLSSTKIRMMNPLVPAAGWVKLQGAACMQSSTEKQTLHKWELTYPVRKRRPGMLTLDQQVQSQYLLLHWPAKQTHKRLTTTILSRTVFPQETPPAFLCKRTFLQGPRNYESGNESGTDWNWTEKTFQSLKWHSVVM